VETPEADDGFFEAGFLGELKALVGEALPAGPPSELVDGALREFREPPEGEADRTALDAERFAALPAPQRLERTTRLLEICRRGSSPAGARDAESFIVFFQALMPTLPAAEASQVARFFFRLVPTLVQIAFHDVGGDDEAAAEARAALDHLENTLLEIADVHLTPTEAALVFRSLDHLAAMIAGGEYATADRVSGQLLDIVSRNRLARALYRLMEAEVGLQHFLKSRLGHLTPQIDLPADEPALAEFGPLRVFVEEISGHRQRLMQVHIPGLARLTDVVLHLAPAGGAEGYALRLDPLGACPLDVPDGLYQLGLAYEPPPRPRLSSSG
jgi:hypothetical protein